MQLGNFLTLYPFIHFDLRTSKGSLMGDTKTLTLDYRLNEATNAQDYTIYMVVLNKEELVKTKLEMNWL